MIKDVIKSAVSDHSDLDHAPFWELLKYFIRRESMSYSKRKAHDRNCKDKAILAEIYACDNIVLMLTRATIICAILSFAQKKLESLYNLSIFIVRSRVIMKVHCLKGLKLVLPKLHYMNMSWEYCSYGN